MDVVLLSRLQFAFTAGFHYLYPPLSIGLGVALVVMEGLYLKTGRKLYEDMTRFWINVFALTFAMGVATGIVMEFEFGTNWAAYSRFVGDVFGSALAAEGIFAFFLESGFLAILVFGWHRVGRRMHFFATCMVSLGSIFSALWILVANSWQQTPAGHHIVQTANGPRAEITDFWAMVFNPSTLERLTHTLSAAVLTGAALVLSVSAWYLLKRRHEAFARGSLRIGLSLLIVFSLTQLLTGHGSGVEVAAHQPAKLAAFEAHWPESAPADMYLFGWVDRKHETVRFGVRIPGMLSWLIHGDAKAPVTGLRAFPPDERPPVDVVFQSYHLMVIFGMALIGLGLLGGWSWWRGTLYRRRWLLWLFVFAVLLPQAANQLGWMSAEIGRQPWIVYGLLRTADAVSPGVGAGQTLFSLILFTLVYALLFSLFLFLLNHKIQHGPLQAEDDETPYAHLRGGLERPSADGKE